jgi:hypothetical protein
LSVIIVGVGEADFDAMDELVGTSVMIRENFSTATMIQITSVYIAEKRTEDCFFFRKIPFLLKKLPKISK